MPNPDHKLRSLLPLVAAMLAIIQWIVIVMPSAAVISESGKPITLRIIKRDPATEKSLQGAVFTVCSDSQAACTGDSPEYITDKEGAIELPLPDGVYYITEISAPEGYAFDPSPLEIVISNGELQEFVFYNPKEETAPEGISGEDAGAGTAASGTIEGSDMIGNRGKPFLQAAIGWIVLIVLAFAVILLVAARMIPLRCKRKEMI